MDRGAWRATVHRVAKSQRQKAKTHTHTHTHQAKCSKSFISFNPVKFWIWLDLLFASLK